tara:strand:+ start:50074 stop:52935 length:2862 start_codon:yes stop_codon:yes gene_type:complete
MSSYPLNKENKFQSLFETMALGVTYQNATGEIIDANPAAQRILGLTLEQMQGKTSMDPNWKCIHEDGSDFPGETHASMVALKTGKEVNNIIMGVFNAKTTNYRWLKINAYPEFRNLEKKPHQVFTTFDDITNERQAQQSLKELSTKYQNIIHSTNIAIIELDTDGKYTYVNPAWENMFGYRSNEALGKNKELILSKVETLPLLFSKLKKGEITDYHQEIKYQTKNGKTIWCDLYIAGNNDLQGNLKSIVGVMIDITNKKKSEQKIREKERMVRESLAKIERSENLLNETGKLAKVGAWELDLKTMTPYFSDETYRIYELPISKPPKVEDGINFYAPEARPLIQKAVTEAIENHTSYNLEAPFITAKGKNIWVRTYGNVEVKNGKAIRLYGAIQNIHEQKIAAIALEESLKALNDYKYSLDQSAIIAFTDNKGVITSINDNFCKISKYSRKEILGKTHRLVNSQHHPKDFFKILWKTIASGKVWRGEIKNKAKDGFHYWVDTTIVPFLDEKNKPFQYLAIRFDITSRKMAEIKLAESENKFRTILEAGPECIKLLDPDGKLLMMNQAGLAMIEADNEEQVLGKCMLGILLPEYRTTFLKLIEKIFEGESGELVYEIEGFKGTRRWLETHSVPMKNEQGDITSLLGITRDVTERKKAEAEKNSLQATIENSLNEIYIFDAKTFQFNYVNKGALFNLGYSENEIKALTPIDIKPDFTLTSFKRLVTPLTNKEKDKIVFFTNHKRKDESIYPVEVHLQLVTEGNNKRFLAIILDITERKKAELKLKTSEERFRSIVESAPDPIFIQTNKCFVYLNKLAVELFGAKDKKELLGQPILKYFHPSFHKKAEERIEKLNVDKKIEHTPFEQILIQLNGNEVWVETKGHPITFKSEDSGLVFVRDISARKLAEKELSESKALLENINNNLPGAIIQYKQFPDGKDSLVYVSEGAKEIWGGYS